MRLAAVQLLSHCPQQLASRSQLHAYCMHILQTACSSGKLRSEIKEVIDFTEKQTDLRR